MASLESKLQAKSKIEVLSEIPETPVLETEPEITSEQLDQHIESSEARIDQQSESFVQENEQRLSSARESMGIEPEAFQQMQQEEGLDAELENINAEEAKLANDTKEEISKISKDTVDSSEISANDNVRPSLQDVETSVNEKSEEPFIVSDPLIRRISDGTYGRPKKAEKREKSISEGGTKYVPKSFDSLGWEETAPKQAEKIPEDKVENETAEIAPKEEVQSPIGEEAKISYEESRYSELVAHAEKKESIEKDPKADLREAVAQLQQMAEQPSKPESLTPPKVETGSRWSEGAKMYQGTKVEQQAALLQERWESKGIQTEKIKIPEGGEFSEAIIFKREAPKEKMVRLYRGVNQMDNTLLDQTPYAMRAQGKYSRAMTVEGMRERVASLAENPTYDNLMAYATEAQQHLNREEARRMQEDVTKIEEGILQGYSVRKELIQKQIEHHGGVSENGLTPYTSASFSAEEAAGYGNGGVMVIDVPISQIEDFSEDSTEVNIKGSIGKEYITAILLRDRDKQADAEKVGGGLENALASVSKSAPIPLYDQEELTQVRQQKLAEGVALDSEQWQKDVERVRENRSLRLIRRFKDINLDYGKMQTSSAESGTDVYTGIKNAIYDQYAERLSKLGREGRKPEEFQYEGKDGSIKYFGKDTVGDEMLFRLRDTVERMEEQEEARRRT
jgi:hypothetical protein